MTQPTPSKDSPTLYALSKKIKQWGIELGFSDVGITHADLSEYEAGHFNWVGENYHGNMHYMTKHGVKRTRPNELEPGTQSIISVRLNYFDSDAESAVSQLQTPGKAYISRYALNKDYHKLMRKRLQQLANKIAEQVEGFSYRAFSDSAPVLERPIAQQAGLGFIGKNSLIIHPRAGSWFFLGELYCNLALPADEPFQKQGCGPCTACINECPTQAILPGNKIDARRCISYLTIEYHDIIEDELKAKMGNRIYGCDDCQLVCPWNKFTTDTQEDAFKNKSDLDKTELLTLLKWNEKTFLKKLEGSPIRRIGFVVWQRNLCTALGNHPFQTDILTALQNLDTDSLVVQNHRDWAINQQIEKESQLNNHPNPKIARGGSAPEASLSYPFTVSNKPAIAPKYYECKKR